MELKNEYKLLWIYILDRCDIAGVWKVNKRMAEFCINASIDLQDFLKVASDRIEVSGDKWLIKKFLEFQYGVLTERNKAYHSIMSAFRSFYKKKGDISPIDGGKVKVMVKETVKKRDRGMGEGSYPQAFEDFWKLYPSRNGKKLLKREAAFQFAKLDEASIPSLMQAIRHYAESGQLPKDAPRFLKDEYWREWIEPPGPSVSSKKPPGRQVINIGPDKETLEKWKREQAPPPAEVGQLIKKLGGKMMAK